MNIKPPKLSVVVPTYAHDETAQGLLDHIRPTIAEREDVEIVLVDSMEDVLAAALTDPPEVTIERETTSA